MRYELGTEFAAINGNEKNGFYIVAKGYGSHYWNGAKIVKKEQPQKAKGRKGRKKGE